MTVHTSIRFSFSATLLIALLVAPDTQAQEEPDPPMEWNSISKPDLAMTGYPADTSAAAVVLCDYGETTMDDNMGLVFSRHTRIKILNTAGSRWGSHDITLYTADNTERVSDIEGMTYSLGPDSSVVETELDDESVLEAKIDDRRTRYRFTLPDLKPGCILEYRYVIHTNNLFGIREWFFQTSIPTAWSEYRVTIPQGITYVAVYSGYESWHINEQQRTSRRISGRSAWFLGESGQVRCNQFRWAIRNAPAVPAEPFVTTTADYCNQVSLQLDRVCMPTGAVEQILKSWPTVVDELLDHGMFGRQTNPTPTVRAFTQRLTGSIASSEAKMAAIYEYLRKTIVASKENSVFAEKNIDDVLQSKAGSNAEITFLLIAMLRCAGIDAHPVLLSTRANGKVQDLHPIVSQFNYVLAAATVRSSRYLLDAAEPLRPMELLPTKALNVKGLLVRKGPIEWVTLSSPQRYSRRAVATVQLGANGALEGTASSTDEGYSALAERHDLVGKTNLQFVRDLFNADQSGLTIDSVRITGRDSLTTPLVTEVRISSPAYASITGDLMYVNPFFINRQGANPFTLADRRFPVEMSYLRRLTLVTRMAIPDGFVVKEMPKDIIDFSVAKDDALFSRRTSVEGNTIQMHARFETNTVEFSPTLYKQLRAFYDQMISAQGEHIVLQRRPVGGPPAVPPKRAASKGKREKT